MGEAQLASPGRAARHVARHASWLFVALALTGSAQNDSRQSGPSWINERSTSSVGGFGDAGSAEQERRLRALNAERQKSMIADVNKLLKLAAELDAEIGGANRDSLTSGQIAKVERIEKLARSVKEKMSTSVRGMEPVQEIFSVPVR